MARRLISGYLAVLEKYPMRVQMVQTGLLCGAGDVISQTLIENRDDNNTQNAVDLVRSAKFAAIGTFFIAPAIRWWYLRLEGMFGTGVTAGTTLKKVATDQICAAPTLSFCIINLVGLSQGKTTYEALKLKLQSEYVDVVINGWKLWPAAQIVNFAFVPFLLRPLYVSVVALFWNTYLAWKTNQD